ncbi:MAG TPA: Hpt domain-containing protein [Candidatus Limnocylindrales bacterium]|nr:Hpt domain-containing protein [Candidatus Limnocylindrales bacterium]
MSEVLEEQALATLLEMVGDDPAFVDELVDAYLADVPVQEAALRDAAARASAVDLVRPAHTLKGASLNLGGTQAAEIAREIEQRARTGSVVGAEELIASLEEANSALEVALRDARERRWRPA